MNKIANQINSKLEKIHPQLYNSLSDFGKRIFKSKGILAQSAEAKKLASKHNATIGIATNNKIPLYLNSVYKHIENLSPEEIFPYAPSTGVEKLRTTWQEEIYKKNPSLKNIQISLPIVSSGITHGLSLVGDLFVNPEDKIILPDQFWGNYTLTYQHKYQAKLIKYNFFNKNNNFNIESLEKTLIKESENFNKIIIILNFPNNPTGYTPNSKELNQIVKVIENQAQKGTTIIAVSDDAYFSFFYETKEESIFAKLAGKHKNIISIKLDGATKEYYSWGLRVGFITIALNNDIENLKTAYQILEEKLYGAIRSTISNVSNLSQNLIYKVLKDKDTKNDLEKYHNILKKRLEKIKTIINNPTYQKSFKSYKSNSGYFITVKLYKNNAEELRKHLLEKHQTGIISLNESNIRIAFSSIDEDKIEDLFATINKAIQELDNQ